MLLKFNKIVISVCLLFCIIIYLSFRISWIHQASVYYEWPMGKHGVRYILYWNSMWEYEDFGLGFGSKIFENCADKNCYTTKNKELIPIEEFDALIFHGVQYYEIPRNNPPKRSPNQIYIYFNLESPSNTPTYLSYSYGFFNWTLTYR